MLPESNIVPFPNPDSQHPPKEVVVRSELVVNTSHGPLNRFLRDVWYVTIETRFTGRIGVVGKKRKEFRNILDKKPILVLNKSNVDPTESIKPQA